MIPRRGTAILVGLALLLTALPALAGNEMTYDRALREAEKADLPVLIKVGAEWCTSCKAFDEACATDDQVKAAIADKAILVAIDGEKGKGKELAEKYRVFNYPTFLLTDGNGDIMDRWLGYWEGEAFVKDLASATENPIPLSKRLKRFPTTPTEEDAYMIGKIHHHEGRFAEAVAYYHRAADLNPDTEKNYDAIIFNAMAYGNYYQLYTADQVQEQADMVLASSKRGENDLFKVAKSMSKIAGRTGDNSYYLPYLTEAIEASENTDDEKIADMRKYFLADYALHIEKDEKSAVEYKKAAQSEGWMDNANQLNNFAWWCFENDINLDEAHKMAERGVELAKAGTEKANILDTLAEICNASGNCENAVDLMRLAVAEDPENDYFQRQLDRFEGILAAQK